MSVTFSCNYGARVRGSMGSCELRSHWCRGEKSAGEQWRRTIKSPFFPIANMLPITGIIRSISKYFHTDCSRTSIGLAYLHHRHLRLQQHDHRRHLCEPPPSDSWYLVRHELCRDRSFLLHNSSQRGCCLHSPNRGSGSSLHHDSI